MSDRPAGHLKCVGYQFRVHEGIPIEHYVFDDGSTWICRNANSWVQDWNPEPQVTRKPHCCEVEINPRSEAIRHYKERIAALEAELKAANEKISEWREAAFPGDQVHAYERTPDGLKKMLAKLKAKPQEDTPLDRWRVMATAVEILKDLSSRIVANCSHTRRQRMAYDLAAMAIETANSSELSSKPYEVK